ncbi:transcriptional regulator [uncultured Jatrophihabitans sp.]|uniref:helix-turn-helix domain-containing protein n=1 Tax=uncultured Jatrophihabitans sp. TaxID=1610747 RepID=UPI0035CB189E
MAAVTTESAAERARRRAHAAFLSDGGATVADSVRPVVADSWLRSSAAGVDPDAQLAPVVLDPADLDDYRSAHPLSQVFPLLYDVLGRAAVDCECVMAVGDAEGKLLWVCGAPGVLRRAESINFVEGAAWDEVHAGTNAPGTALHLDSPVQIASSEHFNRLVQKWSCAAVPIHDPETHAVLGLVDITGGADVAGPQTMGMVRAAARMAESELARIGLERGLLHSPRLWSPPGAAAAERTLRLRGLGLPDCIAEIGGRSHRLSPRHSDILTVLVDQPDGLSAEQLEIEVYAADVHSSTMRSEMTRLRNLLGAGVLQSRPYRIVVQTECDWSAVAAQLAAGRVRDALRLYKGPLLPQSSSPGVEQRRDALQNQVRAAVLASGEADLMVAWTRSRWGAQDLPMWQQQSRTLPSTSPLQPVAVAEARRLEALFGRSHS